MNVIVQGQLINIFKTADFTNKETGEVKEGKVKLQLMCQSILNNNERKNELFDITVPNEKISDYENKIGEQVDVKCSFFTNGNITFFGI
jgi:hypothetical protein